MSDYLVHKNELCSMNDTYAANSGSHIHVVEAKRIKELEAEIERLKDNERRDFKDIKDFKSRIEKLRMRLVRIIGGDQSNSDYEAKKALAEDDKAAD